LWRDEIREGGLFLVSGPGNRSFPAPVSEFLKALSEANPVIEWQKTILERSGETYAQLLDIRPDSLGQGTRKSEISKIEMQDPASEALLTGFYPAEAQGWRWTRRRFSATVQEPGSLGGAPWMLLDGYVSEVSNQKLGKLTLSAKVGPNPLGTATYSQPGTFVFSQRLKPEWFKDGKATVEFELDQALPPSGQESRELGVIVRSITVESK
jgi:hypothetical protein